MVSTADVAQDEDSQQADSAAGAATSSADEDADEDGELEFDAVAAFDLELDERRKVLLELGTGVCGFY